MTLAASKHPADMCSVFRGYSVGYSARYEWGATTRGGATHRAATRGASTCGAAACRAIQSTFMADIFVLQ